MLTYRDKRFYLDGEEFKIRSGSLHYFRTLPAYWESLMLKYRAAGLNCVETYCCWNLHEPQKGNFCFSGQLDLEGFILTAERLGLKVILRPGPFICAEWDNGGLPAWLIQEPTVRLRCNSEPYLTHLREYYQVLFSKIRPHLDSQGGPVIAVALENEYGSFGDDFEYLAAVEKIYRDAGLDCLFFSADGHQDIYLCTGSHDHIVKGIDFACHDREMADVFSYVDRCMDGKGPRLAAEYWGGNFTHWEDERCYECDNAVFEKNIRQMVEMGASFNDYMFFGGTNFGFYGGANLVEAQGRGTYRADITSYDYDAALTEWGDYTEKYAIMRRLLAAESETPLPTPPPSPLYQSIGRVALTQSSSLADNGQLARIHQSKTVEPMEYYGQSFGFIRYRKRIRRTAPYQYIELDGLHDRAHVFHNGRLLGIRMRDHDERRIPLPQGVREGDVIDVLVENMGRVNHGPLTYRGDRKGIVGAILFHDRVLFDWEVACFDLSDIRQVQYQEGTLSPCPAFFRGEFQAVAERECFIHMENFTKGIVFVNGFNLGRYWECGPQTALYLPGALLHDGQNEIVVLETDGVKGEAAVSITDRPGLIGRTHDYGGQYR